jgi:hypothetical protein
MLSLRPVHAGAIEGAQACADRLIDGFVFGFDGNAKRFAQMIRPVGFRRERAYSRK